jgi:hypothetical protein
VGSASDPRPGNALQLPELPLLLPMLELSDEPLPELLNPASGPLVVLPPFAIGADALPPALQSISSVPPPAHTHGGEQKPCAQHPDWHRSLLSHAAAQPQTSPPHDASVGRPASQVSTDPPPPSMRHRPSAVQVVPAAQESSG